MINTACLDSKQTKEEQSYNCSVAQLRLLRKRFIKQYIKNGRQLGSGELSALLLYFALSYIEQKIGFGALTSDLAINKTRVRELTDSDLVNLGNRLFASVQSVLPANLASVMMIPNIESWHQAKSFFAHRLEDALFENIANLGFAYQIFCSGQPKQSALWAVQKANKTISPDELIAFTQLYTPDWVVDFLVANTLLPAVNWQEVSEKYGQWLIGKGCSKQNNHVAGTATKAVLENVTVLDPACGAGQFLLSSFDLLQDLYRQAGCDEPESLNLILSKNLFGADIDGKALWVAGLALLCKCLAKGKSLPKNKFNLHWLRACDVLDPLEVNSFLGSIDRRLPVEHVLNQRFQIIVTNPPYLGRKSLSRELKSALKEQYPRSSADLAAAFLERCGQMLTPGGRMGVITQSSLMTIPSYHGLRNYLFKNHSTQAIVRCGPGVFPLASGEKIDSMLLVLKAANSHKEIDKGAACSIDITQASVKSEALTKIIAEAVNGVKDHSSFSLIGQVELLNNGRVNSCLSAEFLAKIEALPKLCDIAEIRQGMATTDNARFVRYCFDVQPDLLGITWVPYIKGAGSERYASKNPFVVKWGNSGQEIKEAVAKAYPYLKGKTAWVVKNEQYYFRSGLCFSFINKTVLSVRRLPSGCIFDVAASAIFAKPADEDFLLAYLNSNIVGLLVKNINQTINIQVGDLKKLPMFPFSEQTKASLANLGQEAFLVKEKLLQLQEVSVKDSEPGVLSVYRVKSMIKRHIDNQRECLQVLNDLQAKIDNEVMQALERMQFIDSNEGQKLYSGIEESNEHKQGGKWVFDERTCAYKLLLGMVSRAVCGSQGENVVLMANASKNGFSKLFNMSGEVADFLEEILGLSMEKLFCQSKIIDISKLAQEPSRYFSFYLSDCNVCMFFSSAAIRRLQKAFCSDEIPVADILIFNNDVGLPQLVPFEKCVQVMRAVVERLPENVDWTSKDLLSLYKLI